MVRFWLEAVGENCYIYFVFFICLFECGDLCLGLNLFGFGVGKYLAGQREC